MNTMQQMLERYRRDHTHPINRATHLVGIPVLIVSIPLIIVSPLLGLALFGIGMALQLIGHLFEGKAPSFVRDPRFVVVGAVWYLGRVWKRLVRRRSS